MQWVKNTRFNLNNEENIVSLLSVWRHYLTEHSKIATDYTPNLMNTEKQSLCVISSRRSIAIALHM